MDRDFKGVWIPKKIWLNKDLTLQEKVFLVEIDSLDNNEGCYASNQYFADFFGLSTTRVSLIIKSLIEKGYIKSTIIYKEGTKQILKRVLNISYRGYLINVKEGYLTKLKDPPQGKLKDNNTINNIYKNNTINNTTTDICRQLSSTWTNNGYGTLNKTLLDKLLADVEIYSLEWLIKAIEIGNSRGKRTYSYLKGILENWKTEGYKEGDNGGTRQNLEKSEDKWSKYEFE